jgi:predicted HicB family RNase H-like nuclease
MKAKAMEKIDIRLRVDAELHRRIAAAADQEGNSVAAFIRSAVVKELKRREREDDKPQGDS